MPLSSATLASSIQSVYDSQPSTSAQAAQQLAQAYAQWAQTGLFGASTIGTTAALQAAIQSNLASGFSGQTLAGFGQAWSAGLTSGWPGTPVVGAQAGAVIACPGAAALASSIPAALASYPPSTQQAAQILADLLYTATITTTAAVSPPPGTVLPIV